MRLFIVVYSIINRSERSIVPYPLFDCYFSRFPHEFEHSYHTSYTHSTHQHDEHTAHVGKTQLVGCTVGLRSVVLGKIFKNPIITIDIKQKIHFILCNSLDKLRRLFSLSTISFSAYVIFRFLGVSIRLH